MAVTAMINQVVQIGQEGSLGGGGSAGHTLQALKFEAMDEFNAKAYGSQGRRFSQGVEVETEHTTFAISGEALYTEPMYLYDNIFGVGTLTTPGGGTNSRQRIWTPSLTGPIVPKTNVLQWGDAVNVNACNYLLVHDIGMKYTRDSGITVTGAAIAQKKTTGATFTASPVFLANKPIKGKHLNYYLDTTGAGIGVTQLTQSVIEAEWSYKSAFGPYFDSDRSQTSYVTHVDMLPKTEVKLTFIENATVRALAANMEVNQTYFLRIDCQDTVTPIEAAIYYTHQADIAIKLLKKDKWSDMKGVYARVFTFEMVEDSTWAKAMTIKNITAEVTL